MGEAVEILEADGGEVAGGSFFTFRLVFSPAPKGESPHLPSYLAAWQGEGARGVEDSVSQEEL